MNEISAVILGVIEGITEFLPISSTGHLILSSEVLGLDQTEFLKTFEISIQLGAILSVVVLYWRKFFVEWEVLKRVVLAFIPTGLIGLALYGVVKNFLLESNVIVLGSLFVGGVFLIFFELLYREKENAVSDLSTLPIKKCFSLGVFQAIAIIPGVSRSAATIIGGLLMGMKRKTIVEFSFLLAVPTMVVATGFDLIKNGSNFSTNQFQILGIGFAISFIVAIGAIKFLLGYIRNHSFIGFGVYRIIISAIFWWMII